MTAADTEADGPLSRLSKAALCSAATLDVDDVQTMFDHLYNFNSIALTSQWLERIPDSEAVRGALGLDAAATASDELSTRWSQAPDGTDKNWSFWVRPGAGGDLRRSETGLKLYVSPAVDALSSVFPEVARVATYARADCIKVGAHVAGLLRPDKLVVYFSSMEDLVNAAHGLERRLEGAPAHGVPFTAEISTDGLLSWARDPPRHWSISEGAETSWREWICLRSAHALVDSRNQADNPEACCQLALTRLRAEGVDTDRWSPKPALWGRRRW